MHDVSIRAARPEDVSAIASLLETLARKYITYEFAQTAEQKFLKSNDEASINTFIAEGFLYWVAERSNEIIGFVGVRNNSHLYHLFVADSAQHRGVARALWQTAMDRCRAAGNSGRFTVNSSNNAVAAYESFGFVRAGPQQNSDGVLFNPSSVFFKDSRLTGACSRRWEALARLKRGASRHRGPPTTVCARTFRFGAEGESAPPERRGSSRSAQKHC